LKRLAKTQPWRRRRVRCAHRRSGEVAG